MIALSNTTLLRRKTALPACQVGEDQVLLDMDLGCYICLNPVSSYIWELLETERSLQDLYELLEHKFTVSMDRCRSETVTLLEQLIDKKLVFIR